MALHTTTTAYQVPYQMPRVAEPVAIVLADQAPLNAEGDPCNWGVPPNASNKVKAARRISGLIIVTHVIALFFGNFFWGQWIASLIAIVMGCVVLFQFNKCAYTAAAFLYPIAMIFDILSVLFWIMCTETIMDYIADDDISEDKAETSIKLLSTAPGLGAVCLLLGTIVTCLCGHPQLGKKRCCRCGGRCRVQVAYHTTYRLTSATQQTPRSTSRVTRGPV